MAGPRRTVRLPGALDLRATLAPLRQGRNDPCVRLAPDECWRASRTPDGPASTWLRVTGDELAFQAWGPGAAWALEQVPALVGLGDQAADFVPCHRLVADLHRRLPGLRIPRSAAVAEALVPTVIEQKVQGLEAKRSHRALVLALGEPAPGPGGLVVPPEPGVLAAAPSWVFHRAGVERRRAETITRAMARVMRLEEVLTMGRPEAYRRLLAFPGVGPWTASTVALVALGDTDAVPLGDYHLPHQVSWGLAGEARGSDERMLELLDPYRGQRARVLRLLVAGGVRPPRRAPRSALRTVAAH